MNLIEPVMKVDVNKTTLLMQLGDGVIVDTLAIANSIRGTGLRIGYKFSIHKYTAARYMIIRIK